MPHSITGTPIFRIFPIKEEFATDKEDSSHVFISYLNKTEKLVYSISFYKFINTNYKQLPLNNRFKINFLKQ